MLATAVNTHTAVLTDIQTETNDTRRTVEHIHASVCIDVMDQLVQIFVPLVRVFVLDCGCAQAGSTTSEAKAFENPPQTNASQSLPIIK